MLPRPGARERTREHDGSDDARDTSACRPSHPVVGAVVGDARAHGANTIPLRHPHPPTHAHAGVYLGRDVRNASPSVRNLLNHAVLITGGAPVRWFVIEPTFGRKGQIILYRERSAILYGGANQNMEHRIKKTTMTTPDEDDIDGERDDQDDDDTATTTKKDGRDEHEKDREGTGRKHEIEKAPPRWCRGRLNHDGSGD